MDDIQCIYRGGCMSATVCIEHCRARELGCSTSLPADPPVTSKERTLLDRAVDTMAAFHRAITPEEEDPELSGRVPSTAMRTFVDALADIDRERCRLPVETAAPRERMYSGVGHLEATGYIPAGSAAERETPARTNQGDSACLMPGDPPDYDRDYTVAELAAKCRTKDRHIARLEAAELARVTAETTAQRPYQYRVVGWALECFGSEDTSDRQMRTFRFLEEALELAQACGCDRGAAGRVLEYVYGRPAGEVEQEAGGTMVSLAVLCEAFGFSMDDAGEAEFARVLGKIEHIRARHAAKPDFAVKARAPRARDGVFDGYGEMEGKS